MTPIDWKARLAAAGEELTPSTGSVEVLIDLNLPAADDPSLERLEAYGVTVDEVIGNKVVGSLPADRLADLRADPQVAEVELSARLKAHRPSAAAEPGTSEPGAPEPDLEEAPGASDGSPLESREEDS